MLLVCCTAAKQEDHAQEPLQWRPLASLLLLFSDSADFPLARIRGWIVASRFTSLPWLARTWQHLDEST